MSAQGSARRRTGSDLLVPGVAILASLMLVWLATRSLAAVLAFVAGLAALGGIAWALTRSTAAPAEPEYALPDWSVTVAAIEQDNLAVAVTDRAGRLVCANRKYEEWFTAAAAPPRLALDNTSLERLAKAGRSGWRDGSGHADLLEDGAGRWKATVTRAGRGDDYLVWSFTALSPPDPVAELVPHLDGKLGRALAQSGFSLAVVDPDGKVRAASSCFASRATGDPAALLTGKEFTALLRQDEADRITWARDGKRGAPLTMFFMPLADPDGAGPVDYDQTPSLMLIADHGIGIGGGASETSASVPHLEALLGQLPLGLAMADRDGRLLFANQAFMRAAGREGEAPPVYPTDLVVQEDKGAISDAIRRFAQGPAAAGDLAVR
ncbi:MAG: PAS domain-containing protein, partial [Novosphingobium sp.]